MMGFSLFFAEFTGKYKPVAILYCHLVYFISFNCNIVRKAVNTVDCFC